MSLNLLSPQSQKLYSILLESSQPLCIKQLSSKLNIIPNSIYRLTEELLNIGIIKKSDNRPIKFQAKPIEKALGIFILNQANWFNDKFSYQTKKTTNKNTQRSTSQDIEFEFIQSRNELMKYSVKEINNSTKSIDLLRSGHEMPAEVMLAIVKATKQKIPIRMLIQNYNNENKQLVSYWQKNNIQIRHTNTKNLRLMLYDSKILYFMSYKHDNSRQDMGMKVNYPPFASMLSQVFEQLWQTAKDVR